MADHRLPGSPEVALTLRRSGRARRISLRVSQLDGRVTLTLPRGVSEAEALEFASSKAEWIRGHLDKQPHAVAIGIGSDLTVDGVTCRIVEGSGRRVISRNGEIQVPFEQAAIRLQAWLKARARDRLVASADRYAERLGQSYSRVTIRDTRSRWGSCSSQGALMFSWRLILAPPPVLDYVVAHEVAHLAELNHSPAFWETVERIYGPYRDPRQWLRDNGPQLHRYRFEERV